MKPAFAGVIVMVFGAGAILQVSPAFAQDLQLRPWLRNLFSPRRAERVEPPANVPQKRQPQATAPRKKTAVRSNPAEAASPPVNVVEKAADARVVLVVGDFMASGLADGLTTVFAENPAVRVVDRSNGSSGFVRDDYYNWPGEIGPMLEAEKPAVVLVMMGSNDRQQMKVGDTLELEGPIGRFTLRESERPILMIAGATGFAPIKSILEDAFRRGIKRPIELYWGVRLPHDLYMQDLLAQWQERYSNFRYIPVLSDIGDEDPWSGRRGYVHQALLVDHPDLTGYEVYACGSTRMVEVAVPDFLAHGLGEEFCFSDAFVPSFEAPAAPEPA